MISSLQPPSRRFSSALATSFLLLLIAASTLDNQHVTAFTTPLRRSATITATPKAMGTLLTPPDTASFLQMSPLAHEEDQQQQQDTTSTTSTISSTLKNPTPAAMSFLQKWTGNSNNENNNIMPAAAFLAVLFLSTTLSPLPADAAMSGGRMGYSAPARSGGYSRSMPSRSSYGGGGGSYGYRSRPNVIVAPTITPYYSPFYSPFGSPFGGVGVMGYRSGFGFGGFFNSLALFGFGAFALTTVLPNLLSSSSSSSSRWTESWTESAGEISALGPGTSVAQISVAVQVPNRDNPGSLLSALDRLARTARTDSRVGMQQLTSQVALELLRRKSSITAADTKYQHYRSGQRQQAQRDFQNRSINERSKFEQETLSKYGGVDYSSGRSSGAGGGADGATMAVVTLVLAIDGDSTKLPKVQSIASVEEALRMIASDAKVDDCLQSAEILWTPEDRSETLSPQDVIADYPTLRSV